MDHNRDHLAFSFSHLKYAAQPAPDFHSLKRDLSVLDVEHECNVLSFHRTPPPGSFLSLSLSPMFEPVHLNSIFPQDVLQSGFERSCVSEPPQTHSIDGEQALSPLDWTSGRRSPLASPFSDDSDSDEGSSPSLYSPADSEPEEYLFSPPSTPERHHGYNYPLLELYHNYTDDDAPIPYSLTPSSAPTSGRMPLSAKEGQQSPSVLPAPLPVFNSFYYDHSTSAVPCSPRHRAVDLPEDGIDAKESLFGLGLHSTPYSFGDFNSRNDVPPPPGFSHRTTWLSLPGADTDDDLIPVELGSKTYIPDPSITIPTTPPLRSLLIWDPTTRSGLPAGLPSFDGTGHTTHRFDVDALPIRRPYSPDEDFNVDPALLAKLAEQDAEKGVEVQKLCELKQRTTIASVACKSREGAQIGVERTREKWREVTALLRLKLASEEEPAKAVGVTGEERDCAASGGAEDGGSPPSSAPLLGASSLSSPLTPSPSTPGALIDSSSISSSSDCSFESPPPIRRRTSKPKITSMAQLVANMVFHRQQDVLRRSPIRSRTWSPVPSMTHTTASGKTRSWTQTSPTSPLRQMTLPEDLDSNSDSDGDAQCDTRDCVLDSQLELSPLCLCRSPESFYAQLEASASVPLSTS